MLFLITKLGNGAIPPTPEDVGIIALRSWSENLFRETMGEPDLYSACSRQQVLDFCLEQGFPAPKLLGLDWECKMAFEELAQFVERVHAVCQQSPDLRNEVLDLAKQVLALRSAMYIVRSCLTPFTAVRSEDYLFLIKQKRIVERYRLDVKVEPLSQGTEKQIAYARRIRTCAYCCMWVMRLVMFWRISEAKRLAFNQVANAAFSQLFSKPEAQYWIDRANAIWVYTPGELYKVLFERN